MVLMELVFSLWYSEGSQEMVHLWPGQSNRNASHLNDFFSDHLPPRGSDM